MLHKIPPGESLLADDVIWGIGGERGIAAEIGITPARAYYLASRGRLPIRKLGHRTIVASRAELRRFLTCDKSCS